MQPARGETIADVEGVQLHRALGRSSLPDPLRALLVALDLFAKIGLVAALVTLPSGRPAAALATIAVLASVLRALVRAEAISRETRSAWRSLVNGIVSLGLPRLETLREDEVGTALVVDGARETVLRRAVILPDLVSAGTGLALCSTAIGWRVSLGWLATSLLSGGLLLVAMVPALRRQRLAQAESFRTLHMLARDSRALVGAAAEMRASGTEGRFAGALLDQAGRHADAERAAARYGLAHAVVPMLVALLAAALPTSALETLGTSQKVVDLGVLGGAAVVLLFSAVRSVEQLRRGEPYVAAFAALARADRAEARSRCDRQVRRLDFERVSVSHPGGVTAPVDLCFELDKGGLALVGPNGSGKSTALRVVAGLTAVSTGRVLVNDMPSDGLAGAVAFLPQRPFSFSGESLRYHLSLCGVPEERVYGLLEKLGLAVELARRAGGSFWDLPLGSLSGGERQRFFVARTLATEAPVVLLDEPEQSLDDDARANLREAIAEIAQARLVLMAVHDVAIVPKSFARVECAARLGDAGTVLPSEGTVLDRGVPVTVVPV